MLNPEIAYQLARQDNEARIAAAALRREARVAGSQSAPWWGRLVHRRRFGEQVASPAPAGRPATAANSTR